MYNLKVVCQERNDKIQFKVSLNDQQLFKDQKLVSQILIKNQKKGDIFKQYTLRHIRFQYLWNGSLKLIFTENSKQTLIQNILIKSSNRVTLQGLFAKKVQINARSLYIEENVQIQNLLFFHQKQFMSQKLKKMVQDYDGKQALTRGRINITQKAKLRINKLEVVDSDIIVRKNAFLNISWKNGYLNLQNTQFCIHPYGTLCAQTNLAIKAYSIQNKGIITVKSQDITLALISIKFRNTGHIKINSFAISAKVFQNQAVGKIQGKSGTINLNGQGPSQNKGKIVVNNFEIVNTGSNNFFCNLNILTSNIITGTIHSFQNKGQIVCNNFCLNGSAKNSFFSNEGLITPLKELQLKKIHVINSIKGKIQNLGNLDLQIQAWINQGNIVAMNDALITSKGIIKNKGVLAFNKNLKMKADILSNQNQLKSKNSSIEINQVFMNMGKVQIQKGSIIAGSLTNLEDINLIGSNIITTNIFTTKNKFGFGSEVALKSKQIYFEGNIQSAKNTKIEAEYMANKSKTNYDEFIFKGDYMVNPGQLNIKKKGKIEVQVGFSNPIQGKLDWNQVQFYNKNQIGNFQGQAKFKKTKFNNIKDIYGSTQIIFQDIKQQFRGINLKDLGLKNTHLAGEVWALTGTITAEKGGLYQGKFPIVMEENPALNNFVIQVRCAEFYKSLNIVLVGKDVNLQTVAARKYLNGMTLLQRSPIIIGNFHHHLISDRFELPEDKYYYPIKKTDKISEDKQILPCNGQKSLKIEANQLKYRGSLVYDGNSLTLKTKKIDLKLASVQVPSGIISLQSQDSINLIQTYLTAKGINLKSQNQITTQAVKFVAGLEGILMSAKKINDRPKITLNEKQSNGLQKKVRIYQTAQQSQFLSEGNIIIKAEDYIHFVAPIIQSKRALWINSPNTLLHGIFLLDKTRTEVQKDTMWGGTKTNTYQQRNDKPLPAQLKASQIYLEGSARINATFKTNKIYDLTKDGVQMFFVIGYYGDFQNRQFCNFATQGVQGRNYLSQKLLKANLKEVAEIIRPLDLPGHMKFNTVQWDKNKIKITGSFKETVYKTKSWFTEWQHQTVTKGLLLTVGLAASFVGANFIAPYFTAGLGPLQIAMVKAGFATLTNKFAISLLGSGGDMNKAFKNFFSSDTLKALVFNVATAGITGHLSKALGIQTVDFNNNPIFTGIFKENILKHAVNISLDAVINGNFPKNLQEVVTPFVVDVFGEYAAGMVGKMYLNEQIGYLLHKGIHGVIGGIGGFLQGKNVSGIVSGALAAIAAEVAMEAMVPIQQLKKKADNLLQRMKNGEKLTGNQIVQSIQKQIAIGKIIGIVVGGIFGKNWDIAKNMATNAVDHNWVQIAVAVGHVALKALLVYLAKKGYDNYLKPQLLKTLKISQEQKKDCDVIIEMVKDGFDIWKGFSAWTKMLKNPPKNSKQALIQQIQNFSKTNPLTLGTKIARFTTALTKINFNKSTLGYLCAGFVQAGLFYQVDKLIGTWKSFTGNNLTDQKVLGVQGVGIGFAGLAAINTNIQQKKYIPKENPINNGKSYYEMQQNMLNFGIKKELNFKDLNNQVYKLKDIQHYDRIQNLQVK